MRERLSVYESAFPDKRHPWDLFLNKYDVTTSDGTVLNFGHRNPDTAPSERPVAGGTLTIRVSRGDFKFEFDLARSDAKLINQNLVMFIRERIYRHIIAEQKRIRDKEAKKGKKNG